MFEGKVKERGSYFKSFQAISKEKKSGVYNLKSQEEGNQFIQRAYCPYSSNVNSAGHTLYVANLFHVSVYKTAMSDVGFQ